MTNWIKWGTRMKERTILLLNTSKIMIMLAIYFILFLRVHSSQQMDKLGSGKHCCSFHSNTCSFNMLIQLWFGRGKRRFLSVYLIALHYTFAENALKCLEENIRDMHYTARFQLFPAFLNILSQSVNMRAHALWWECTWMRINTKWEIVTQHDALKANPPNAW